MNCINIDAESLYLHKGYVIFIEILNVFLIGYRPYMSLKPEFIFIIDTHSSCIECFRQLKLSYNLTLQMHIQRPLVHPINYQGAMAFQTT